MSNDERGRKLMAAAQEYLGEMRAALARDSWNITVRHAQEVVELAVKGVLCYLCIDYPKVHDAADLLVAALTARQMRLGEEEAADLRAVSSQLAEQRAPAFYFEYDEERGTAEIAARDATGQVLGLTPVVDARRNDGNHERSNAMARADYSIVPERLNPDLTPELEREVRFFRKWGYLVVDDAITPEQVEVLRAAMDDADARDTVGWNGEPNPGPTGSLFRELLEEDDRFAFLLDNPPVLTRIKALLGNAVQLHSATGRVTPPGTPEQNWHRDGPWPQDPDGTPFGSIPGQINCGYYLDELTMDNGPIVIVPGSHRAIFKPPKDSPVEFPDELRVLAKPGQAVLFSGWLYHRGAANNSDAKRRVCLMCYQNAWMKSRETFDGPKMTALSETGTPERKLLLGGIPRW